MIVYPFGGCFRRDVFIMTNSIDDGGMTRGPIYNLFTIFLYVYVELSVISYVMILKSIEY